MTVAEEYKGFINANHPSILMAQYSIESSEERLILLMTDKQFKTVTMGDEKDRVINFKDVKSLQHTGGDLVVESEKNSIRIRASEYDYNKILRRWQPPVSTETSE